MNKSGRSQPRSAFTLTELLAVIAILSVIVSLLLSAVGRTRGSAMSIRCMNNLRQLGVALDMYVTENHEYPTTYRFFDGDRLVGWLDLVQNFAGPDPRLAACPAIQGVSYQYNGYGSGGPNYHPNLGLGGDSGQEPLPESGVKVPSEMIAMSDVVSPFFPPRVRTQNLAEFHFYPHKQGLNVVFTDSHVEHVWRQQLVEPTDLARRRWNNDNKPHRETW